ncbi:MAG: hypothetical protein AAFV43_14505 [Planctomycetota bacterium]
MLTTATRSSTPTPPTSLSDEHTPGVATSPPAGRSRLARVLRVEWIGQTAASLFWIASVVAYGITSTGDWLQLAAASAWLAANTATIIGSEAD